MTNAALVAEVCRAIRGIAANYPDGFALVCQQVDALRPPVATTHTYGPRPPLLHLSVGDDGSVRRVEILSETGSQPSAAPKEQESGPTQEGGETQQVRRKRGRPRKVRTGEQA